MGKLDTLIQEKIDADAGFQESIASLSDEEKQQAIASKKSELIESEYERIEAEANKNGELASNYKTRAEKAEKAPKESKAPETSGLDTKDVLYISKADIHEDDLDDVLDYAKLKNISIKQAHEFFKPILASRAEQRKTADANNVRPNRSAVKRASPTELLERAKKGDIPAQGSEEAEALFWARRGKTKN